jgi:hypothetical protein
MASPIVANCWVESSPSSLRMKFPSFVQYRSNLGSYTQGACRGNPYKTTFSADRPLLTPALPSAKSLVWADGIFSAVDVEAAVFPGEEIGDLALAEMFAIRTGPGGSDCGKVRPVRRGFPRALEWKRPSLSKRPSAAKR